MIERRGFLAGAGGLALTAVAAGLLREAAARPLIRHETLAESELISRPDADLVVHRLSLDMATGGSTCHYAFPANWRGGGVAHYHSFSEEVFVLDGDITLDGSDYFRAGDYLYRPGGIVHGHHEGTLRASRMIIRTGGPIDFNYVKEPTSPTEYVLVPNSDGRAQVLHLKTREMPGTWVGGAAAGYVRKVLSLDAGSGASTELLEFPHAWRGRLELAGDASWEWYVVAGRTRLDDGTAFEATSYSFRPAGEPRALVRAAAGTQVLIWRRA